MRTAHPAPIEAVRAKPAAKAKKKHTKITSQQQTLEGEEGPINKHWRTYFLQQLAATSNVSAAAKSAGVATSRAYKARREEPDFAARWRAALSEGYEHLEMEVLGWLRNPDPDRKFDVANAIRLLAAHRAAIAQQRALTDSRDEQAILDSIDAMIDEIRERSAANAALLLEDHANETSTDPDHAEA